MVFSSSIFLLLFLPIFLLVYELSTKKVKNYTLLLASIVFYAWGAPKFIFILILFTIINYYVVNILDKKTDKKRKLYVVISIVLNVLLLVVFKYSNLFVLSLNSCLNYLGMKGFIWHNIALPIGISFFIFQSITYSVDVYRKVHTPSKTYFQYLLYIIAFPQLIAGPIVRYTTIADEINDRKASIDDKLIGFYRFSIGLAKKAIIANAMAMQADMVFSSTNTANYFLTLSTPDAWLGIIAFTFQIYFDFSGYSDMAIGLGRIMGFHYPENFNNPYTSYSITEFWKRWHITLGSFMKDYLYIPLGGNRVKTKRRHFFNLWLVFLLSGLWHGAAWNFLFWGIYHGFFLIMDKICMIKVLKRLGKIPSLVLTFFVTMIGWSVFAIGDIKKWFLFIKHLFSFQDMNIFTLQPAFLSMIFFAIFFAFGFEKTPMKKIQDFFFSKDSYSSTQHVVIFFVMLLLFVISLSHIVASPFNPFIYFRF